jgi:hypothetical protein
VPRTRSCLARGGRAPQYREGLVLHVHVAHARDHALWPTLVTRRSTGVEAWISRSHLNMYQHVLRINEDHHHEENRPMKMCRNSSSTCSTSGQNLLHVRESSSAAPIRNSPKMMCPFRLIFAYFARGRRKINIGHDQRGR